MNHKQRTAAFDAVKAKALAHARANPATASVHAAACANAYGEDVGRATERLSRPESTSLRGGLLLLALVVVLVVVACAGCIPQRSIEACTTNMEACRGHAEDESLPIASRLIALDQLDAWAVEWESLAGQKLPADVLARIERTRAAIAAGISATASSVAAIDSFGGGR